MTDDAYALLTRHADLVRVMMRRALTEAEMAELDAVEAAIEAMGDAAQEAR
jgi:hypothetical protein